MDALTMADSSDDRASGLGWTEELFAPYFQRRRLWFRVALPVLVVFLAVLFYRAGSAVGILIALILGAILVGIMVTFVRARSRRTSRKYVPAGTCFSSVAILIAATVQGEGPTWLRLRNAARPNELGIDGVWWVDTVGFHWRTARTSDLELHVDLGMIEGCAFPRLGAWMSGLSVATSAGARVGLLLPRVDREAAIEALRSIGVSVFDD